MSAVDKLHKLYSSTLKPVVWARSVGLEVLNEFDSVKAAIMMDAGAYKSRRNAAAGAMGWAHIAANGVEGLSTAGTAVKFVGQTIGGMVNGLRTLRTTDSETPKNQK
jgi:ubiquinone biosynthesis monooxygenase Coq6